MSDFYTKIGEPVSGRQYYGCAAPDSQKKVVKYSVPVENVDKFEKINEQLVQYNNKCLENSPNSPFNAYEKRFKTGALAGGLLGAIIPAAIAVAVRGSVLKRSIIGGVTAIAGAAAGAIGAGALFGTSAVYAGLKKDPNFKKIEELHKQAESLGLRQEKNS